jgi:hypothetical protein
LGEEKRIITGSDILGCLLRGTVVECELGSGRERPLPPSQPGIVRRTVLSKEKRYPLQIQWRIFQLKKCATILSYIYKVEFIA